MAKFLDIAADSDLKALHDTNQFLRDEIISEG